MKILGNNYAQKLDKTSILCIFLPKMDNCKKIERKNTDKTHLADKVIQENK